MQVLQIANSDDIHESGAVRAMHNLHQALGPQGITSKILCGTRTTDSPDVARIKEIPPRSVSVLSSALNQSAKAIGLRNLGAINSFFLGSSPFYQQADVLHIHSIHNSTFSYASLPSVTKNKPTIFTLHDMWPATGHCAFSYDCERWKSGCGKCPYPDEYPAINFDNTRLEWYLKHRSFEKSNITFVAPSRWMLSVFENSVAQGRPLYHIPYGIDTQVYAPADHERCRLELGIPTGKHVIMAGAVHLKSHRKGGDLLLNALALLPHQLKKDSVLLLMGNNSGSIARASGMEVVDLGYVTDERIKVCAYCASDLFVFPTRADNLPLTLLECMACGTPMISFRIGGVPDLVRDGVTGRLADPENARELAQGIVEILEDDRLRDSMRTKCRGIAESEYASGISTMRYIKLYNMAVGLAPH